MKSFSSVIDVAEIFRMFSMNESLFKQKTLDSQLKKTRELLLDFLKVT